MKLIFHLIVNLDIGHCGNQKYFQKPSYTFTFHQKLEFSMYLCYVRKRSKRNRNGSKLLVCKALREPTRSYTALHGPTRP